jgi:ABC-2 type transport system permease protein
MGITAGALQRLDRQVGTGVDSRPAALRLLAEATQGAEGLADAPAEAVPTAALDELTADLNRLGVAVAALRALPADVIVSPFTGTARRVAGVAVGLTGFYAPAVVVLLLQHLVVTFIGLSTVREEQLGTTELFRVAPLSTAELLAGKFLAYLLLGGGVSAVLVLLLVTGLGVPMLGSWWLLACSVVAVLSASIAMGFVIALLSGSDSQAVQYAMLALLSSIFFSGFILSSQRFVPALDALAHLLPATYGIAMLRGEMLRGSAAPVYLLGILAGMTVLLLGVAWVLLSRRLRRG